MAFGRNFYPCNNGTCSLGGEEWDYYPGSFTFISHEQFIDGGKFLKVMLMEENLTIFLSQFRDRGGSFYAG